MANCHRRPPHQRGFSIAGAASLGYGYIDAAHADRLQEFYRHHFNPYLNFHRPCAQSQLGIGPTPLADGHLRCSGLGVVPTLLAVLGALAQVIQMGHGNRRQTFVVALAVDLIFPFQNVPCRRPAEGFMRLVDSGQQFHIPGGITLGKAMSLVYRRLDPAGFAKAGDQPGYLGPAHPRHLLHVLPQQAPAPTPLLAILVVDQELLDPAVDLFPGLTFEPDSLAPFQECLDLVQIKLLGFMHADRQSSACHLQAHLALESALPFRLILYWTRLVLSSFTGSK